MDEFLFVLVSFPSSDASEVVCECSGSLFSNVKHARLPALKWHCALKDEALRLAVRTFNPEVILLRDADLMLIPNVTDRNLSGDHRQLEEQASSAGAANSALAEEC